ncbi:hypothetical protein JCM33374_g151 [Metschnikowia sp. JCM 33374]|nr:hypothetical protein JCM33374_g151 [Metschnikowia sp. JCM 33374]
MNNYLSEFISRFGGQSLGITSYSDLPDKENGSPVISFIALFNPAWAKADDESFEGLSRQILFFVTPQIADETNVTVEISQVDKDKLLREQLNIVGLIRGSCSLLSDFGSAEGPITIEITDGAIVVIEIDKGYYLAICLVTKSNDLQKNSACVKQLLKMSQKTHRMFELVHSPLTGLLQIHGRNTLSVMLRSYWTKFMKNYNFSAEIPFGPVRVLWPNRLNHRGFFQFLPKNCYKKSTLKIIEPAKREIDRLVFGGSIKPTGYFVANMDSVSTKYAGIIHVDLGAKNRLNKASVIDIYNLFEDVSSSHSLTSEFFSKITKTGDVYSLLSSEWKVISESSENNVDVLNDEESEDEESLTTDSNFNSTALGMLNPVRLTNTLVVSPLAGTVNGFKNLGLVVSEHIYEAPTWLNRFNYFGTSKESTNESANTEEGESNTENVGQYLIGLVGDEITRFLVHIPTATLNGSILTIEYSLIVYKRGDIIMVLFYESGIEALEHGSFYSEVAMNMFQPLAEVVSKDVPAVSFPSSNSTNSLPDPIRAAVSGKFDERGGSHHEIDSDFFFIIHDPVKGSYETSLPSLQVIQPIPCHFEKQRIWLNRVLIHLHDHLINHFILETKERIFNPDGIAYEQLHKFSSSKNNDWLFYSMRHQEKVIIIIRNSNHKAKTKPLASPQNSYLMNVADSVYGAANLGFLESLGGDVRTWLGGVGKQPNDKVTEDNL